MGQLRIIDGSTSLRFGKGIQMMERVAIFGAPAVLMDGCASTPRVKGVDHSALGVVERVDVVDGSGNPLEPEPGYTSTTALISLTVRTTLVIRTSFAVFPETFQRVYRPAVPEKVEHERSGMLAKELLFLVKGTNMNHATWCGFEERITNEAALVQHMEALPVE